MANNPKSRIGIKIFRKGPVIPYPVIADYWMKFRKVNR